MIVYLHSVHMGGNVVMGGTSAVMSREERGELSDTEVIGLLETTAVGSVKVGLIFGVSVTVRDNTTVNTGGVCRPQVHPDYHIS